MGTTPVANPLSPAMALQIAQGAIAKSAIKKRIQLASTTVTPAQTPVLNVQLQNVGLLRGLLVKCVATVANADGALLASLSDFGPANMWSQVVYNDLSNVTRIQTTGAHLFMLDCMRRQGIMGAAYTNDNPGKFGANWAPITAPATIAHGATGTIISYHWIPVAYSDTDFRGAVFSNITNASQSISLTFNPLVSVPTGTDSVNALYGGVPTANMSITSATVTVYQDVYDQLPGYSSLPRGITPAMWAAATGDVSGLLLPNAQMKFMYELKFSPFIGSISANVENTFPYTNQRQFLSTIALFQNPTRTFGTDTAYWRLVAANSYEWWKMDPLTVAFEMRRVLLDDFPAGFYLFDTRNKPINTVVSGNMSLVLNPTTATAGTAGVTVYYEDFALTSTITAASSLSSAN